MKLPTSLSELKRLNANSEDSEEHETEDFEEAETEATDDNQETLEGDDLVDQNEADDVPAWLQTGEDEDTNSDGDVKVPLKAHIAQRKKFQGNINSLRTDIESRDTQIEALTQTIEDLREAIKPGASSAAKVGSEKDLPPVLSDFENEDSPESAHQAAMLEWSLKTFERRQQQAEMRKSQQQQAQEREQELTRHYNRAAALVEAGQLTPEEYRDV